MDAAKRHDAAEIRQWWTSSPQLDEDSLRSGILSLLNEIHQASVYDDWDVMQEYIQLYRLGESYCNEEPHLSAYEFGKMGIEGMVADHYLSIGDYANAVKQIESVIEIYNGRMARYVELGTSPRRASQMKTHYLLTLANLKWMAPAEWKDAVLTPEQVLSEMGETAKHVLTYISEKSPGSNKERDIREGLALAEAACCKMALRYTPTKVAECVRQFNLNHGQHLALPQEHFKDIDAASSGKSAYYWDFELAKLRMSDNPTPQDIYMCIELRSLAARDTFGDWPIQGLLRNWRREALMIIREVKLRDA